MKEFLPAQVVKLFHLDVKQPAIVKAEKLGRIDSAVRKQRGDREYRYFPTSALPSIGKVFGKITAPKETAVIAIYTSKGGVGKTTTTYNLSRFLALHGLRVLSIGTDFQRSLSRYFGVQHAQATYSLFDLLGSSQLSKMSDLIIKSPDLDNHYFVPESRELNFLEMYIYAKSRREELLKDKIQEIKGNFDVIIIDCPPWWSQLVSNALFASDYIIGPINADADSQYAFEGGLHAIGTFRKNMKKSWKMVRWFANNIDLRNKVEKQIHAELMTDYRSIFASSYIRRYVQVKEASVLAESVMEYAPDSQAADDAFNTYSELWTDLLLAEEPLAENAQSNAQESAQNSLKPEVRIDTNFQSI
ncbi:MAG: ParA family protein [Pseudobdellovibrionaceae bacterium]|nr:ParA family protein [Pseudobdellovibrionaceae bacterium]